MGMAASQARLLSITARMHDIEFKAQSIQNAKIQLATQSDQVYNEYLDALNAETLTMKNLNGEEIPASFDNIRGMNAVISATGKSYALRNSDGLLIVEQDEKDAYDSYEGSDPYHFAMAMLIGSDGNLPNRDDEDAVLDLFKDSESDNDKKLFEIREDMNNILKGKDPSELEPKEKKEYENLEKNYRFNLYKNHGSDILEYISGTDEEGNSLEEFKNEDFNYFVNLFKQIKAAGGCISVNDKEFAVIDSEDSIRNSSDWLKRMVQAGQITIEIVNTDKNGDVSFNTTSTSSDTNLKLTQTSSIDSTELAKAEAKYEHDTKKINQKDKKFDMDLSKLETERSALKTEYDSVKKVINDNIERTFGIFS